MVGEHSLGSADGTAPRERGHRKRSSRHRHRHKHKPRGRSRAFDNLLWLAIALAGGLPLLAGLLYLLERF